MTDEEAIRALDNITLDDPEVAHGQADDILLQTLDFRVKDAYERVVDRQRWWAAS